MIFNEVEKKKIQQSAFFLEDLGYIKKEDKYCIEYLLNNISISIVYPPNSLESEVNIHFIKENKFFDVGWMAFVTDNIIGNADQTSNVIQLLRYIYKHYHQIIDYQFCEECNLLVDEYVATHTKNFEKAINKFLFEN